MQTIIGININTKTAREQDLLINQRECRDYCGEPYNLTVRPRVYKIIQKITDCNWEIDSNTVYLENGEVRNTIVFMFHNEKGIDKKALRAELTKYIDAKFKRLFKG